MDPRPDDLDRVIEDFKKELTHAYEFIAAVRAMATAAAQAEEEEFLLASYSRTVAEFLPAQSHTLTLCLRESEVQVFDVTDPQVMAHPEQITLEAFGASIADAFADRSSSTPAPRAEIE